MNRQLFVKGLKLEGRKHLSRDRPLQQLPLPPVLKIGFNNNGLCKSQPVVTPGDSLTGGDIIATPGSPESSYCLAPTSATVIEVTGNFVLLEPDGLNEWHQKSHTIPASRQTLIRRLRKAGIRGLGGGGFPTHHKLAGQIKTLIINAVECEPWLTCDYRLMMDHSKELIRIMDYLIDLLNVKRCILALKSDQAELLQTFSQAGISSLEVAPVPDLYPSGSERFLIHYLTGQQYPPGIHPSDRGMVCQNIGTLYSIYQAVFEGRPQVSRITTVCGDASPFNGNIEVLNGTQVQFILDRLGIDSSNCSVKLGGPLTGQTLDHDTNKAFTSAKSNCIFVSEGGQFPENPCIRCGRCADVCTASLLPHQLLWNLQRSDKLAERNLPDCIECGACDSVCPSHIPITSRLIEAKKRIHHETHLRKIAGKAALRFDHHLKRRQKEHQNRQAHLGSIRKSQPKSEVIAGALARKQLSQAPSQALSRGPSQDRPQTTNRQGSDGN